MRADALHKLRLLPCGFRPRGQKEIRERAISDGFSLMPICAAGAELDAVAVSPPRWRCPAAYLAKPARRTLTSSAMRDWRDGLSDEIRQLEVASQKGAMCADQARRITQTLRHFELRSRKVMLATCTSERHLALLSAIGSRGHGIAGRRRQGR